MKKIINQLVLLLPKQTLSDLLTSLDTFLIFQSNYPDYANAFEGDINCLKIEYPAAAQLIDHLIYAALAGDPVL